MDATALATLAFELESEKGRLLYIRIFLPSNRLAFQKRLYLIDGLFRNMNTNVMKNLSWKQYVLLVAAALMISKVRM